MTHLRSIKFIKLGLRLLKFIKFMIYTSHDCKSRDPVNLTNFTNRHHFMNLTNFINLINLYIMAIFQSNLFDKASGSVGNVTMCQYKGKNVAKGKIFSKKKKQSPAQRVQQVRFATLSKLSFRFCNTLQASFRGQSWSTARAAFIGTNQNAVEVDEETLAVTIHPERITCSTGNLLPPAVAVTCNDGERRIHAEWFRQPLSPVAKDKDDLFLAIFDQKAKKDIVYPLGKRGEPGKADFPLPKKFQPESIIAYVFAVSPLNTRASRSAYTEVKHE